MKVYRFKLLDDEENKLWHSHMGVKKKDEFEYTVEFLKNNPLITSWKPITLEKYAGYHSDTLSEISLLNINNILLISKRLADLINKNQPDDFDFLNTISDEGVFYILKIKTTIDALIEKNSYVYKNKDFNFIYNIFVYDFDINKIKDKYLFILPQFQTTYFATEAFKNLIEKENIESIVFWLVWDSEDPNYINESWTIQQWKTIKSQYDSGIREKF